MQILSDIMEVRALVFLLLTAAIIVAVFTGHDTRQLELPFGTAMAFYFATKLNTPATGG